MIEHEHPMPGQALFVVTNFNDYGEDGTKRERTTDLEQANVVASVLGTDGNYVRYLANEDDEVLHKPVLDLDFPAKLIPSTTEGHYHLYLDVELPWPDYERLLLALADAGILEEGYVNAAQARKHTAVRLPWVKKPEPTPAPPASESEFPILFGTADLLPPEEPAA